MSKTKAQWIAEAVAHMEKATWHPKRFFEAVQEGYPPGHEFDWMRKHNYQASVALWNAVHPPANPAPPPVVPPAASVFSGKGAFTTSEPGAVSGHPCDWVALQADPEGNITPPATSARICWWQARPTRAVAEAANDRGIPYIGQAENEAELTACLALSIAWKTPHALVGNMRSLMTGPNWQRAVDQGWDGIAEWYWNAHPWETGPDGGNYPRFVNVCFGIYSEGEPGGDGYVPQSKTVADYRAVWHGSFSVWKAESMTGADWTAFTA